MIGVIKFPRRLPDLTGYGSLCTLANLRACTNLWHELVQVTSHISRPERNPYNKWSLLKTPRSKGGSRGFTRCGSSCVRKSCKCELLKTSIALPKRPKWPTGMIGHSAYYSLLYATTVGSVRNKWLLLGVQGIVIMATLCETWSLRAGHPHLALQIPIATVWKRAYYS